MKALFEKLLRRGGARGTAEAPSAESPRTPGKAEIAEAERLILEGNGLEDAGRLAEAESLYREALRLCPTLARVHLNIGNVQLARDQFDEAAASYREALRLDPGYGAAHANLGKVFLKQDRYEEAATHYSEAASNLPDSAEAQAGLGSALEELGRRSDAIEAYRKALEIQPEFAGARLSLGRCLMLERRPDEAVGHLEAGLAATPDHGLAHVWMGKVLSDLGFIPEAVGHKRRACELGPEVADARGMLVFAMNYLPECTPEDLFAETLEYASRFCASLYPQRPQYGNAPYPERQLRVGYVSGDFRHHPVARFVEPVFMHHDRARFEVHGFYNNDSVDVVTERLQGLVDGWHPIKGMDQEAVANLVRTLGIDILVDLSGYTEHYRLQLFARKPAPVQATWLGYLGTTGLATMDYRICDAYTDPVGMTERFHTEKLARMPDSQWCFAPHGDPPPVGELPMLRNGYPTLGSFNVISKINDQVIEVWADVLNAIPSARLRIGAVPPGRAQSRLIAVFGRFGVAAERLEFLPRRPYRVYLASVSEVDIALDPFPYNGGTTSVDALFMGVPVVTLAGDRSISRGGVSLLSNVGLPELISSSPGDYVENVRRLSADPEALAALRAGLRERLERSPLMDGERFARNLEALYRQMWREWCESQVQS